MAARRKVGSPEPRALTRRLRQIARSLEAMIGGDVERQIPISNAQDELDAVCYSMNILVGELAFATANVRRAQAEAEAANAAKSAFLRSASHELRTPLAVIVWLAETLRDPSRVPPERFARSLAGIRRSAEELLRTADAVLDLSRLDQPNLETPLELVDLVEAVREVLENLQPLAERKQLRLRLVIAPGVPAVLKTNGQYVRQVIVNLVANAIKFTQQGEVVVRLQREDSRVLIDVEDTGIGIPPEARDRIFEPFFQVNRAASQRLGGSGVGLALAKRFAEKLGGEINLRASVEGEGSTFRFVVPIKNDSGVVEVVMDPGEETPVLPVRVRPLEGLRVLVADDEELVLDALCKLLETAGATVGRAADGEQAMALALAQDFALILMDIRMPVLDGLGATSRLRAAGFWRPIVALTASATADQRAACLAAGCNDHLTKPIAPEDLVSKVAAVCRRLA
ncbi:MAG TPA: ATP-binding protein [Polyangia bacterium]|nr:ATP-binding protein [Polyangia bacterium]